MIVAFAVFDFGPSPIAFTAAMAKPYVPLDKPPKIQPFVTLQTFDTCTPSLYTYKLYAYTDES